MGRKRNRKQSPLFYINQPNIKFSQPDMQNSFFYKDDEAAEKEILTEDNNMSGEVEVHVESSEIIENEEVKKKKKNFQDYTLEEKIRHLKLVPAAVAKVKYEFVTVGRSYKGYFMSMKNGVLLIHSISPRKKSVSIPVEDLVDIKRLGL